MSTLSTLGMQAVQSEPTVNRAFDDFLVDRNSIEQSAHDLVSQHVHFRGRARNFDYECHEDVLVVRGSVPSYYLKQLLQSALMELEGVVMIDNQVDVISSYGLSSVRGTC
jgi:hypothetical protein